MRTEFRVQTLEDSVMAIHERLVEMSNDQQLVSRALVEVAQAVDVIIKELTKTHEQSNEEDSRKEDLDLSIKEAPPKSPSAS